MPLKPFFERMGERGSVSNLLVIVVGGLVESLKAHEVHLAHFKEQVFHIKEPASLGLDAFDCSIS